MGRKGKEPNVLNPDFLIVRSNVNVELLAKFIPCWSERIHSRQRCWKICNTAVDNIIIRAAVCGDDVRALNLNEATKKD